ncbi:Na+/H+ antiporter subunit A [Paeniglutamicibacter gangotriensis]|uniref:Na+/H+ antiporter subunit A n=1 Tax=Paeniglutamicibacter gangotriensis TaxID=254787 RepID=A0A5B0E705_9MICC|nr:Na+/H+ antiporter subunit A [Paeniglutamicibacter gangotriensis]KAA0973721.1 Na+/H+ antiporter subunit A [Paeniglutamicibacter gangotriensis]
MLLVLIALFAVAGIAPFIFRLLGRSTFYVLSAVPALAFVWLLANFSSFTQADQAASAGGPNAPPSELYSWIGPLNVHLDFRMDALSAVLCLLVLGVGALVLFYCARYFKNEDPHTGAFGAQLLAFAASMFGLVTADDMILLFIFWELTTILSFLLIGFNRTRMSARRSALTALIVTTFGGLTMLAGIIMLGTAAGTYRISEIMAMAPELSALGTYIDVAIALLLIGAISKSALVPFHFWLPGAMAAPTPVSAYLHAAAMVKAGVYLIARLSPGFNETAFWQPMLLWLGLATMLIGGWRALKQHDLKLLLAYGTVSQLGFMILVLGVGTPNATLAALAMMLAHGFFKATLFLVVGIIDHKSGTRDLHQLSGLYKSAPLLFVISAIAVASMAGVPPLFGFVAKESVYEALLENAADNGAVGVFLLIGVVAGAVLTFAYSARFLWGGFANKTGLKKTAFPRVPLLFLTPLLVLSAATLVFAWIPHVLEDLIAPFVGLLPAAQTPIHLGLWHGLSPALGLSILTMALGAAIFLAREKVFVFQSKVPAVFDAERDYKHMVGGLDNLAIWLTGRTQRGSLSFYLIVIMIVALVVPVVAMLWLDTPIPGNFIAYDHPAQLVIGLIMILGAVGAVQANRRFLAVLMVSVTGYGMAAIFALQGAPDLAVTQLLVETIVLVAFVLALRALPVELWAKNPTGHRLGRALIGIGFGAAMVLIAATAMASRVAEPISLAYPELAYVGGAGKNIVNVTLVDMRAWDTFGEITVLAAAATGVASLIFVRGRGDTRLRASEVPRGSVDHGSEAIGINGKSRAGLAMARTFALSKSDSWLVAGHTLAPERRSITFEVVTRLLFHTILLSSVYLLLAGHNTPGGGFAGGLLAGLALTIRYLAGGRVELAEATPVSPGTLMGAGLGLAALSAAAPLLFGAQMFASAAIEFTLPVFGEHKFVTSTVFDIGVYLVVVGLVIDVLRSLGSEIDERSEGRSPTDMHDLVTGADTGVGR